MFSPNEKRERLGWCLYDWANSAFATTIMAAILPVYFAEIVVPDNGLDFVFLNLRGHLSATSLWGYASGLTSLLIMVSAPVLGAIADHSHRKKFFLMTFCYVGSLLTMLLFFSGQGDVFYTLVLFCMAHYFFVGGNVFYDAFLPFFSFGKDMNRLSGQGYALGYLGGGLLLALNILFIQSGYRFGVSKLMSIKLSLASAGFWWAMFGTLSFFLFHEKKGTPSPHIAILQAAKIGFRKTWHTARMVAGYKHLLIFLLAFMIYNDGVQTVIKMAAIYGKDELHLSTSTLLGTLLMVQFLGIGGALLMSRMAGWCGTKRTIMAGLVVWFGLTLFAYRMETSLEFWILGIVAGLILGGTQALSRSFYGSLIPKDQSAQFFGYYSVFAKFSAIWGPIIFAYVRQVTGTARLSILSLALFFLTGWILLFFVKEKRL
ncbi:MAG: MFS transporter [Deltaproteobacteria bacterium]|nr:MFS transporter [Deltaproteobacteria bacterium]